MMRRATTYAALALAAVLALSACNDPVEMQPLIDGRIAHTLPGETTALVAIDQTPTFQLEPFQHAYFFFPSRVTTYDVALGDDVLSLQVEHDQGITAILLMDIDGPALRAYHLDHQADRQRIAIINANPHAGDIHVLIQGSDSDFTLTVSPTEAVTFDPPTGAFSIQVRGDNEEIFVDLEPFLLMADDHGFLVLVPASPHGYLLF